MRTTVDLPPAVHQRAQALAASQHKSLSATVAELTVRGLAALGEPVEITTDPVSRLPHVVTFSCLYVDGEAVVTALDAQGFAVGSGSACTSSALEPSHVLAAMGALTHGNVRIGLPRDVREADVDRFLEVLPGAVAQVRAMAGVQGL